MAPTLDPAEKSDFIEPEAFVSRLQAQLEMQVAAIERDKPLSAHPFIKTWAARHCPLVAISEHCRRTEPNRLLVQIRAALSDAIGMTARAIATERSAIIGLAVQMSLVACERWIAEEITATPLLQEDLPSVRMSDDVAAAIVAAKWLNLGLRVEVGSEGARVTNVIRDHAEVQLGVKSLEEVYEDEIREYCRGELTPNLSEFRGGRLHRRQIRAQLDELEERTGARLVIAVSATRDASLDGTLRQNMKALWNVETFRFNVPLADIPESERMEWEEIQTTIAHHFRSLVVPSMASTRASPKEGEKDVSAMRSKVFVSYAHRDEAHRQNVDEHLKVLEAAGLLDVWDDRDIGAGEDWEERIDAKLRTCKVAVLLISPAFLGSDFIRKKEVPELLERHGRDGMHIMPIMVRFCAYKRFDWLARLQIRPRDAEALAESERERDRQLAAIADEIATMCGRS